MTAMSPDQIAAEWAQRLAASTQKIQSGVQAVSVSPGAAAARQKAAWLAAVQANADKWARRVSAVQVGDWQAAMINKGIPRIATGASAAQPKFTAFMTRLLPAINTAKAGLPARGNLQQNIARMTQFVTAMSQFGQTPGQH